MKDNRSRFFIWALILVITLIWGYAWVLMKDALKYMGPFTFSAFRFGTGALTLLLFVLAMKMKLPPRKYWPHFIVVGLLQTSVVFLLVMYGLKFVDAGKSSIILYTMPIWSSFLAAIFLKEKMHRNKLIGLVVGMLGLILIIGWDVFYITDVRILIGEGLIVVAAIAWGISNVYYRMKLNGVSQIQVSAYQMFFGAIGIIIAAVVMEWGEPIHLNGVSMFHILFTGVLASALCFTVWFMILSKIDMVTATLSTLLVPVFGMFFSWLQLGEAITINILLGALFIITGITISQMKTRKKWKESTLEKASG